MVKHVILWTLKDSLSDEEKKSVKAGIKEGLEGLAGQIPGLTDIHVYTNGLASSNADVMLDSTKIGTTRPAVRVAQTTVQVIDLAAHRLYKTVKTPVIEQNGEIHYTVSYKNNTDSIIEDFQLLDILPYNGDSRGTDYTGSMQITRLVITQKDENGNVLSSNDNLRLYYTSDESAKEATAKDQNLGEDWILATSENIMSNLTAFAVKGTVGSQGLVTQVVRVMHS